MIVVCMGTHIHTWGPFKTKFDAENWLTMIHCQRSDINDEEGRCFNDILSGDHIIRVLFNPMTKLEDILEG